ncbi:ANTAR domain-containing protein [Streptomyces sp. NPDC047097]|uniref:ANTAR domain-containing protein n=1 Tax=Streptomyces sp. NPDC047097 TaxID=3155260 RepID=UPI0033F59E02
MPEQEHRIGEISALREEIAQLRHAVVSHAVIDQAIGVVLAYGGLRSDAGWEVLREVSQHTNTKLREVAEYLVQWPHCAWLPPEIHRGLDAALRRRGSLGGAPAEWTRRDGTSPSGFGRRGSAFLLVAAQVVPDDREKGDDR